MRRYLVAMTKAQLYAIGHCVDSVGDHMAHSGSKTYTKDVELAEAVYRSALGFSKDDFERIDAALRLRAEACEDNCDKREARKWEAVRAKFEAVVKGGSP